MSLFTAAQWYPEGHWSGAQIFSEPDFCLGKAIAKTIIYFIICSQQKHTFITLPVCLITFLIFFCLFAYFSVCAVLTIKPSPAL
jgi:hypothetical protein